MAREDGIDPNLRKRLMARSHALKAAVQVGQAGLTPTLVEHVNRHFRTTDLLKVRIQSDDRDRVRQIAEQLARDTQAALVHRIGKVALLYKPQPESDVGEQQGQGTRGMGRGNGDNSSG